jgi:hypothetical protein
MMKFFVTCFRSETSPYLHTVWNQLRDGLLSVFGVRGRGSTGVGGSGKSGARPTKGTVNCTEGACLSSTGTLIRGPLEEALSNAREGRVPCDSELNGREVVRR